MAVLVQEEGETSGPEADPPQPEATTQEPLCWMLLTTLPVDTFEQAAQCVHWYRLRWVIERSHLVLKSGCRIEELQGETAARLERAVATYCIVGWGLLGLAEVEGQPPESDAGGVVRP